MNARKNARANMLTAVSEVFQTDQSAYKYAPALIEDLADLNGVLTELDAALEKAEMSTTELAKAKDAFRAKLTADAKKFIGIGTAHAAQKDNMELKGQLFPFSKKLDRAKDSEFPIVCANLLKPLKTIPAEDLAKRGVAPIDITTFEADFAKFKASLSKNKGSRDETSTEISRSEQLTVKGCAIVTDRITPTMESIKDSVPIFYAKYNKAATIKQPATSSTQLVVVTLDATNDAPLEGAAISGVAMKSKTKNTGKRKATSKTKAQKPDLKTSEKGEVALKHAKNADLKTDMLTITREGYQPLQVPMPKLPRGKITTITVRLTPLAGS